MNISLREALTKDDMGGTIWAILPGSPGSLQHDVAMADNIASPDPRPNPWDKVYVTPGVFLLTHVLSFIGYPYANSSKLSYSYCLNHQLHQPHAWTFTQFWKGGPLKMCKSLSALYGLSHRY